jgi:hypothetical protein
MQDVCIFFPSTTHGTNIFFHLEHGSHNYLQVIKRKDTWMLEGLLSG